MSLNGVSGIAPPLLRPQENARARVEQDRAAAATVERAPNKVRIAGAGLLAPRQDALSAEAPEGTDPELWQVLSADERAFFARMTAMGPLTYGRSAGMPGNPAGAGDPPPVRGGRLDVKA